MDHNEPWHLGTFLQFFHYSEKYFQTDTPLSPEHSAALRCKTNSTLPTLHYVIVYLSGHTVASVVSNKPKPDVLVSSFQRVRERQMEKCKQESHTWWQVSERRCHELKKTV